MGGKGDRSEETVESQEIIEMGEIRVSERTRETGVFGDSGRPGIR